MLRNVKYLRLFSLPYNGDLYFVYNTHVDSFTGTGINKEKEIQLQNKEFISGQRC